MDQTVWGPPLWHLLEDVAWAADQKKLSEQMGNRVLEFFHSLTLAIPCSICRTSYTTFFQENAIGPYLLSQQLLKWVWLLHDMVNRKLGNPSLPYKKLCKRMSTWTQASSASTVWDIMFIVVYNIPVMPTEESTRRIAGITEFIKSIPYVMGALSPVCADKQLLASILLEPVTIVGHRDHREYWIMWLYGTKVKYDMAIGCTPLSMEAMLAKYRMASA